jgi:hypothetical protein
MLLAAALAPVAVAADEDTPQQGSRTRHSSDGVIGKIAPKLSPRAKAPTTRVLSVWPVAPGVTVTSFDRIDARGNVRGYVAAVDLDEPGLSMDYLGADTVRTREAVSTMVEREGAVLGVNGDFFDIADTQAPLGVGIGRGPGVVHGPVEGWNAGFWIDRAGKPQIGELAVKAKIKQRPKLRLANYNSPTVAPGSIGAYSPDWGYTVGARVTDGQTKRVREVVVDRGRVISNRTRLSTGREIFGAVLIGRGKGAEQLRALRKGTRITVRPRVAGRPPVAITGNKQLLDEGVRTVVDDREMHPRTAVGIDRDTNTVFLTVIDGRQSFSRGYTMVELANLMLEWGCEDALNLDGGGSSAMAGLLPDGTLGVLNSPSDGSERKVPDGLQVVYSPPVG